MKALAVSIPLPASQGATSIPQDIERVDHVAVQVPNLLELVANGVGLCSTVRSGIEFSKNFLVHVVIVVVIDLIFKIVCW